MERIIYAYRKIFFDIRIFSENTFPAGGSPEDLGKRDGINQWPSFVSSEQGKRDTVVVDIDDVNDSEAVIKGSWKLIKSKFFNLINGHIILILPSVLKKFIKKMRKKYSEILF